MPTFFFSSGRRHTRWSCDWSSDVCSSDLELLPTPRQLRRAASFGRRLRAVFHVELDNEWGGAGADDPFYRDAAFHCGAGRISCVVAATRSEERRVGKECSIRRSPYRETKH